MGAFRSSRDVDATKLELGLRANWQQFSLLVLVNAFVGAMVGMERSILPAVAEQEFKLATHMAILAFIAVFGVTKGLTNYFAGRFSDSYGRKTILVAGWLIATPVPFLLMWAPSWNWVLLANAFLGVSQGLTWSATVIMKIDLAGSRNRGLAMGINEFAGYFAIGGAALATGWIAGRYGLRPEPFYLGVAFVLGGLLLSALMVRETRGHARQEAALLAAQNQAQTPSQRDIFWNTSWRDPNLSSISQAGLVNNLNDGMGPVSTRVCRRGNDARTDRHACGDLSRRGSGTGRTMSANRRSATTNCRGSRQRFRKRLPNKPLNLLMIWTMLNLTGPE